MTKAQLLARSRQNRTGEIAQDSDGWPRDKSGRWLKRWSVPEPLPDDVDDYPLYIATEHNPEVIPLEYLTDWPDDPAPHYEPPPDDPDDPAIYDPDTWTDATGLDLILADPLPPPVPRVRPRADLSRDQAAALIRHMRGLCSELESALGLESSDLPLISIPGRYSPLKAAIGQILTESGPLTSAQIVQALARNGTPIAGAQSVPNCLTRNFMRLEALPASKWCLPP